MSHHHHHHHPQQQQQHHQHHHQGQYHYEDDENSGRAYGVARGGGGDDEEDEYDDRYDNRAAAAGVASYHQYHQDQRLQQHLQQEQDDIDKGLIDEEEEYVDEAMMAGGVRTMGHRFSVSSAGSGDGGGKGVYGSERGDLDGLHHQQQLDGNYIPNYHDLLRLHVLCDSAREDDDESWEAVRQWIQERPPEEARQAAENLGEYQTTSLHLACSNRPPVDIVHSLISVAPDTVRWADSFGWLPLHYACAKGASEDVLQLLCEAFPESTTATDNRGRTPLHFALGNTERPATPTVVILLAATGAASTADKNGMLPLHYACAYGASEEALEVLTSGDPASIITTDRKGRTPLHFALGNADRPASLAVVRLLLSQNRDIVNSTDNEGQLPLHLLATRAHTLHQEQKQGRENAEKCLELYLNAEPIPTADFLTGLQSLPEWLCDKAVVTPIVQELLNQKIAQRFPTAVILLDLYFLLGVIVTYWVTVKDSINRRDGEPTDDRAIPSSKLSPLYIGAAYFLMRELIQMMSLLGLGLFQTWLFDPTNWLDVTFIVLVVWWAIMMHTGTGDDEFFRNGAALTVIVLYTNFLSFLKSLFIDFAVFVGGVFYVVQRLAAFLIALVVILVAFAQMFFTVFRQTPYCQRYKEDKEDNFDFMESLDQLGVNITKISEVEPGELNETLTVMSRGVARMLDYEERPFCDFWTSFLKVYTMLLGEVDEAYFEESDFARGLFVIFMFLVVILLANLLIAIVTDSYGVIKNERAAIVFWSNRLDFVAEMDAMSSGPWQNKVRALCCLGAGPDPHANGAAGAGGAGTSTGVGNSSNRGDESVRYGARESNRDASWELWKKLVDLFEDDLKDLKVFAFEFWCYMLMRLVTALFLIPMWLLLGLLSAGWLWPPQVREHLFIQSVPRGRSPQDMLKEPEQRQLQIHALREEIQELQDEVIAELAVDRRDIIAMKRQLARMKTEVTTEMRQIKQIVTMLFDMQSAHMQ